MESYVLRIYRRDDEGTGESAGTVHVVESGEMRPFRNWGELLEILRIDLAGKSEE